MCHVDACWIAIKSPKVVPSPTLLAAFDGHSHRPHGIILAFIICVGGNVVNIKVEIIDANFGLSPSIGMKLDF